MKIIYLENDKIIFNGMNGKLDNSKEHREFIKEGFIIEKYNIDIDQYEYIYTLDDGWAGTLLLVKGNKYCKIKCGSGRPYITESKKNGILEK